MFIENYFNLVTFLVNLSWSRDDLSSRRHSVHLKASTRWPFRRSASFYTSKYRGKKSLNLQSLLPSVNRKLMWTDRSLTSAQLSCPEGPGDGAEDVKSFQIKGRDRGVLFVGALDYITVILSRLDHFREGFTHLDVSWEYLQLWALSSVVKIRRVLPFCFCMDRESELNYFISNTYGCLIPSAKDFYKAASFRSFIRK